LKKKEKERKTNEEANALVRKHDMINIGEEDPRRIAWTWLTRNYGLKMWSTVMKRPHLKDF